MNPLALIPWPYKLGAFAAILAALGLWHWNETRQARNAGYAAALADIRKANEASNNKASAGEAAVIACHAAGKDWNRETGKCAQ